MKKTFGKTYRYHRLSSSSSDDPSSVLQNQNNFLSINNSINIDDDGNHRIIIQNTIPNENNGSSIILNNNNSNDNNNINKLFKLTSRTLLLFKYLKSIRFLLFLLLILFFAIQFITTSSLISTASFSSSSSSFNVDNYMPKNYYYKQIFNSNNNNNNDHNEINNNSNNQTQQSILYNDNHSSNSSKIDSNPTTNISDEKMIMESLENFNKTLPNCPLVSPNLVGKLKILTDPPSLNDLETMFPDVEIGGHFKPKNCISSNRVAIIVPYRDREYHLRTFLYNMHPMLMRQNIDYGIFIVEQMGNKSFNRAKLMNVGFLESSKQYPYDCFIFHDVDLIPEDDRNLYTCPEQPRHMSVAVDKFNYRLPYKDLFGGVSALTKEQFIKVNGFSNEFWGWGGEDDDMSNRVRHYGYKITRYSSDIARYKMLKHKNTAPNTERFKKLYNGWKRYKTDGINNINYNVVDLVYKKLYTWIAVELFAPDDHNHHNHYRKNHNRRHNS